MRLEPSSAARQSPLHAINGNAAPESTVPPARGVGAVSSAGQLALAELEISLGRSWRSMERTPERVGTVARIVEEEEQRLSYLGDATALDRLEALSRQILTRRPESIDSYLIAAQVATMRRRFAEARVHLRSAQSRGATEAALAQLDLDLQQATGEHPVALLARRRLAASSGSLKELAALARLLDEVGEGAEAERTYHSIRRRRGSSPFLPAWACFRLALLRSGRTPAAEGGESKPAGSALHWLEQALEQLPRYVGARLCLVDFRLAAGDLGGAESALRATAMNESDPEVGWRLAALAAAQGHEKEAGRRLDAVGAGFDALLQRHELAFAEPAARFFLHSGRDPRRAFELARNHLANQPTLSAFELAHAAASALPGESRAALRIATLARARWGHAKAFAGSPLDQPSGAQS